MRSKATPIGNSMGMIIPKELINAMNIKKGDEFFLTPTKDGFTVVCHDAEIERQMGIAKEGMNKYRHALRKLADS